MKFLTLLFFLAFISCDNFFDSGKLTQYLYEVFDDSSPNPKKIIEGTVIKVPDGDTLILLTNDYKQIKIRLDGIDCPEKKQDFGNKAKEFTEFLCDNKRVIVESMGTDRYQRVLGIVRTDSVNINEELLKAGLAWHYKSFNNSQKYAFLEMEAQKKKLNIWSLPSSIAPWEFRAAQRKPKNKN